MDPSISSATSANTFSYRSFKHSLRRQKFRNQHQYYPTLQSPTPLHPITYDTFYPSLSIPLDELQYYEIVNGTLTKVQPVNSHTINLPPPQVTCYNPFELFVFPTQIHPTSSPHCNYVQQTIAFNHHVLFPYNPQLLP